MIYDSALIASTFIETLERVSFQFADHVELSNFPEDDGHKVEVCLSYTGDANGTIYLWAGIAFAKLLAANMLGIDENDEQAEAASFDSVRELNNIYAGQLLPFIYDHQSQHLLGNPACKYIDDQEWKRVSKDPKSILFCIDDEYPLIIQVIESGSV